MSKNVATKSQLKRRGAHKKTVEYVIHKTESDQWAVKEQCGGSERIAGSARAPKGRKISDYTREEADWLNSLVHSAARAIVEKG